MEGVEMVTAGATGTHLCMHIHWKILRKLETWAIGWFKVGRCNEMHAGYNNVASTQTSFG